MLILNYIVFFTENKLIFFQKFESTSTKYKHKSCYCPLNILNNVHRGGTGLYTLPKWQTLNGQYFLYFSATNLLLFSIDWKCYKDLKNVQTYKN